MWTVKELINILKKHDPNSLVAIQHGYFGNYVKSVSTLNVDLDKRYAEHLRIKGKWRGDTPITFLTVHSCGVEDHEGSLYG